jgi:gliding motility-associated protein GldE
LEITPLFILQGTFLQVVQFHALTAGIVVSIIVTLILLTVSALVSGSEVAYFSLKAADIVEMKEQNTKRYNQVLKHLEKPELLLAVILIANNFVNVAIVILSAYISTGLITFVDAPVLELLFDVVFITGMLLFFGEIFPKVYAGQIPRKFAALMAYPLLAMKGIFKPLAIILVKSTGSINRRFTKKMKNISLDEISQAIDLTNDAPDGEKEILKGIVTFGNINVEEIMTGRVDVVDIDIKSEFTKVISVIVESGYSRIPVYEESPDNVKGVLYVKDLLPYLGNDNTFEWHKVIRPAYYVPETKRINDLLQEFKKEKIHMAIVVDEYGGTSGIVTLEDILEEIVGDISDELDDDDANFSLLPDGSYIFEGKTLLKDFFRITDVEEDKFRKVTGEAETLAGLLLEVKGEIPLKNEVVEINNCDFTVVAADNRRIKKIKFVQK